VIIVLISTVLIVAVLISRTDVSPEDLAAMLDEDLWE